MIFTTTHSYPCPLLVLLAGPFVWSGCAPLENEDTLMVSQAWGAAVMVENFDSEGELLSQSSVPLQKQGSGTGGTSSADGESEPVETITLSLSTCCWTRLRFPLVSRAEHRLPAICPWELIVGEASPPEARQEAFASNEAVEGEDNGPGPLWWANPIPKFVRSIEAESCVIPTVVSLDSSDDESAFSVDYRSEGKEALVILTLPRQPSGHLAR